MGCLSRTLGVVVVMVLAGTASAEVRLEKDVVYTKVGDEELKLDVARPAGDGPFPAVVCLHGGVWWTSGKRQDLHKTIEALAARGYVAVSVDYRLAPAARFPAPLDDARAAVRWLRANASTYSIDPERVGALGFGPGAHLACLLGTTSAKDEKASSKVQAVVSFFALTDLTRKTWNQEFEDRVLVPFLGETFDKNPDLYGRASPLASAGADAPPFLLLHGEKDTVIRPSQSRLLAEKLQGDGVMARLEIVEGEGHGWTGEKLWDSVTKMVAFFDAQLKKK